MGWQDAPVVEEASAGAKPAWMDAPLHGDGPEETSRFVMPKMIRYPGGLLQMVGEPVAKVLSPLVEPVNRGLVSLAGGITKGAANMGLIKKDDPIAQAGFSLTPQQLIETRGKQIEEMTGSPWAGAIARKVEEFGPASPGSWAVPAALAPAAAGVTNAITNNARGNVAAALANQSRNATRDASIDRIQEAGYAIPPSLVQTHSGINTALESFAGKAALKQEAALRAQRLSTELATRDLGLPPTQALSPAVLRERHAHHNEPYETVDALRPQDFNMDWFPGYHDTDRLAQLTTARATANDLFRNARTRVERDEAFAARARAQAIEDDMGRIAEASGDPALMERFRNARTEHAKIRNVSEALNDQTGNVSSPILGKALNDGAPLTGNLRTIGEFDQVFPQISKTAETVPAPGVSATNAITSAMLAGGGAATMGPWGAMLAAAPLARGPVRNLILSRPYQNLMVNPRYAGPVDRGLAQIPQQQLDPMVAALLARGVTSQNGDY